MKVFFIILDRDWFIFCEFAQTHRIYRLIRLLELSQVYRHEYKLYYRPWTGRDVPHYILSYVFTLCYPDKPTEYYRKIPYQYTNEDEIHCDKCGALGQLSRRPKNTSVEYLT